MDSEPRLQRRTWASTLMRALVLLVGFVCMVGFAVALAKVTLVPSVASVDLTHTNLTPGSSIRTYVDQPAFRDTVKQVGGNVLLGMPFGVLLPVLIPKARGLLRVVLVTAFVMLLVETAQGLVITGRAFDIDDVILNTTGALLGYLLLGRRLGRALHPRRVHWWQRAATRARREEALGGNVPATEKAPATAKAPATEKAPVARKAPAKKTSAAGNGFRTAARNAAKKTQTKGTQSKGTQSKGTQSRKTQAKKTQPKKTAATAKKTQKSPAKSPAGKSAATAARWWAAVRPGRRSAPQRP
ncbi:VanZ family protein [Streptomyces sp. NPDC059398]|uniref:VanZ family protein n=1 Tax=Streptomyces sp. NPDC059398 TaxID=3346820 RepID=UPI0036B3A4EC